MRPFFETDHCTSGAHCRTCRDFEAGRKFRREIVRAFAVPDLDWGCPRGHPWGYIGPVRGLGDTVAAIIHGAIKRKPCSKCHKRREALNRLVPYRRP